MRETDVLPSCPGCGGADFRRDSIFEAPRTTAATSEMAVPAAPGPPDWLEGSGRAQAGPLPRPRGDDEGRDLPDRRGWTRIGRSGTADLRLDDPSVSRRHALDRRRAGQGAAGLDDRSLNGVFVNGQAIEWCALRDGDELQIGRYKLYALTL